MTSFCFDFDLVVELSRFVISDAKMYPYSEL